VTRFLESPDGQAVMELLEAEFFEGNLFVSDPYQTAFNLGRRDAVLYLKQLRDITRKEIPPDVDPLS
jgi:hypothetical protein